MVLARRARPAQRPNPARKTVSRIVPMPAPTGGWNAKDALASMPANQAIVLDNLIPDAGGVRLRNGYEAHITGLGDYIESLMEWNGPAGTKNLFAATTGNIFDVSSPPASVFDGDIFDSNVFDTSTQASKGGLTSGRWQHTMFATTGGNYLVCCNGADAAQTYNGSVWADLSITGVATTALIHVTSHFSRLWFVQKDTLDAWYLGTAAISGAATKFSLGPLCKLGGHLLAIASWTRDGGSGLDDMLVLITSKGEALIYQGTDPADAATWLKKGVFRIPEPIGRRCVVNIGSDLAVITSQGLLPFSAILSIGESGASNLSLTNNIYQAFDNAYMGGSTLFGWQVTEFPHERLLIINIPITELGTSHQYVMNTQTGGWCRFTGLNAYCWSLYGDDMYFGGNGSVYRITDGYTDGDADITATSIGAYNNLGTPHVKRLTMVRPMVRSVEGYLPSVAARFDYEDGEINYSPASSGTSGDYWDQGEWDVTEWGGGIVSTSRWRSLKGVGSVISFALSAATSDALRFDAVDLMIEDGGYA